MSEGGTEAGHTRLPTPGRERWQPLRGGLLNLYRYDAEEFWFEDGHLLLRGNNGTGKSRVLALQLPFLLDGDILPSRVEPDGDSAKKMEWNLLMGKYEDRVGYTWLEFGRRDADGTAHYLTLGCGLSATEGRQGVPRWFFITRQRVGQALFLQGSAGQPLSRERLEAAVAGHGHVYHSPQSYREAVDAALFHLGKHRYDALVNLLIQLRQPQLSRHLDERKLSQALSEALPPLSSSVLADIAESFRGLERDRGELEAFLAVGSAVERFLGTYRHYLQVAARRRGEEVRSTHSAYESIQRRLRTAEGEMTDATGRLERAREAHHTAEVETARSEAEVATLESSEVMQGAQALDKSRERAERAEQAVTRSEQELRRVGDAHTERRRDEERARGDVERARKTVEAASVEGRRKAEEAGLAARWSELFERSSSHAEGGEAQAFRAVAELVAERARAIKHLRPRVLAAKQAEEQHATAVRRQQEYAEELEEAMTGQAEAQQALRAQSTALLQAHVAWRSGLRVLSIARDEEPEAALEAWCEEFDGVLPFVAWTQQALAEALARLAGQRATSQAQLGAAREELRLTSQERAKLERGEHVPPPAPHTRDEEARARRESGAPLWKLCDFSPDLSGAERAGLEAALESSGLLDAWVTPKGELIAADEHETRLLEGAPLDEDALHLGRWLVPDIDAADPRARRVDDATVARILRGIGGQPGTGTVWVDRAGRWRVGPLEGRYGKPRAEHIGHASREEARRRALEALGARITSLEERRVALEAELKQLEELQVRAHAEARALPDDGALRRAGAAVDLAAKNVHQRRLRLTGAERAAVDRRLSMEKARRERDVAAEDLQLTPWVSRLYELEEALRAFEVAARSLWSASERLWELTAELARCESRLSEALAQRVAWEERLMGERVQASAARAEYETLHATVGVEVEALRLRLEVAKARLRGAREQTRQYLAEAHGQDKARAAAEQRAADLREQLAQQAQTREKAVRALEVLARLNLLGLVDERMRGVEREGWSASRGVEVARHLEAHLAQVESGDAAWARQEREVTQHFQTLNDALARGDLFHPQGNLEDSLFVAMVLYQGRACDMAELRALLDEEVTHRQSLLDSREREVLERHLIDDVSTHLHDLIHAGERWVQHVNAELEKRPTSMGMSLRFKWEPVDEGPAGMQEVRKRLLRARALWSPAERQSVGDFLKQQIDRVRAERQTASWQEQLEQALDYRAWHQFSIERHQEGQWRRLTRRTHGTGSGGEKAIALTLPQFAAAAAHYRSAHPHAPRLILLDEVFVGIDTDMRGKCMGLLAAFDLDFVMTSEREWACYATLPGVAICQLATQRGLDAIHVTRFVWNGRQRVQEDVVLPPSKAPEEGVEA
ncbi:TIGR02680 family protein [Myxococcus fulvus]|uniref:TIGR02680 family protein n=1 Tax=Myxococcus fulvus TaxID=33 RepID=UPI0020C009D5|nr:TIGR02680 family protein [Myxococcus fulvus]MCK8501805.1 TIGR02680 family protein [Myxococcus fulvus]